MPIIPTPENATELTQHRSLRSKVFALANGKRRLVTRLGRVHFQDDDGQLKDIETDVEAEAGTGELVAAKLPYRFRLHKLGIGFDYESRAGGIVRVALVGINGQNNFDRTIAYDKTRNKNRVRFADVRTDLDIVIEVGRSGVKTFRILKSATAPRNFRWAVEYDEAGASKIGSEIRGLDNLNNEAREGRNRRQLELSLTNSTPTLQGNGRMRYFASESWTGKTKYIDPTTRIASWVDEAIYPVAIDPDITEDIGADNDDGAGRESNSTWKSSPGSYGSYLGANSPTAQYDPGFRFQTVAVDQGVTIDLANLKFNVTRKFGAYAGAVFYGDDVDDSAAWSDGTRPSQRTKTSASVTFARPSSTGIKTVDVTSIVQEIVNRGGWASGNDISLFGITYETTYRITVFEDFSNAGTDEAQLEIDYTAGGGGGGTTFHGHRRLPRMRSLLRM